MDSATLRFGTFEIGFAEKLLRRGGEPVPLPPKAVETLIQLVESPGQLVTKEELMAAVWPDVVVEENNLTQQISILRKTFAPEANGDGWIQTVPKRGYRFTAPVEIQTTGQNQRPEADSLSASGSGFWLETVGERQRRRAPLLFALGAVVVLVGLAIMLASFATRPEEIRTVAVLPIQPLTPNDELSAVGLGISDALVQRLSYAPDLSIQPMASMRRYLGESFDPVMVGRELNVDAVLAGTIQRDHDRYRVTMELVDIRTNRSRWNVKIEESATDAFKLQDLIAESALRSLPQRTRAGASIPPQRRTPDPAAHEAFLKGRYYWSRRTGDDVERSIAEFERAVSMDDSYAAAWAGLASAINLQALHFIAEPEASFARSRSAARQALLLDPALAEAHAALGFISFYYEWNWSDAEKSLRRAIQLDPSNGNYRQLLSNLLIATGRTEEAIREIEEAMRVDPGSVMVRAVAGRQYYLAGRYQEAVAFLRQAIEIDNTIPAPHYTLGLTYKAMGQLDEAERNVEEAVRRNFGPMGYITLGELAAHRGDRDGALQMLDKARQLARNGASLHYDAAIIHGAVGDPDEAFRHLEAGLRERYSGMVWLRVDPRLDPLRNDPRFAALVARVGL